MFHPRVSRKDVGPVAAVKTQEVSAKKQPENWPSSLLILQSRPPAGVSWELQSPKGGGVKGQVYNSFLSEACLLRFWAENSNCSPSQGALPMASWSHQRGTQANIQSPRGCGPDALSSSSCCGELVKPPWRCRHRRLSQESLPSQSSGRPRAARKHCFGDQKSCNLKL